jgi:5-methylcytosine-specific restriction endonuclease McrA
MQNEPKYFPYGSSRPLTRLRQYKRWIQNGWALDLNDAVRLNGLLRRKAHYALINYEADRYPVRQAQIMVRRREHLTKVVLAAAVSCTVCGETGPTRITHIVPPSQGGTDSLRNLVPCCEDCCQQVGEWPEKPKWPHTSFARDVAFRLGL